MSPLTLEFPNNKIVAAHIFQPPTNNFKIKILLIYCFTVHKLRKTQSS